MPNTILSIPANGIVRLIAQRGNQPVCAAYCTDAHRLSLSSSSLSLRDHQSLLLALVSLLFELSRCRRTDVQSRCLPFLMRPSENGVSSLVRLMPTVCAADLLAR